MRISRHRWFIPTLAGLVFFSFFSWGQNAPGEAPTSPGFAKLSLKEKIKIKTPDGRGVVTFKKTEKGLRIGFNANGRPQILRGKMGKKGKRNYLLEGVGPVARIKPTKHGFKVKGPDGRLLWKVRIGDHRILVSDNEEHRSPFVLVTKQADRVRVLRDTTEIGAVRFLRDRNRVRVRNVAGADQYKSKTDRYSAMYGVLMMGRIPERERYIIMAELFDRGR